MRVNGQLAAGIPRDLAKRSVTLTLLIVAAVGCIALYTYVVLLASDTFAQNPFITTTILLVGLPALGWIVVEPIVGLYLLVLLFPLTNESIELSFVTVSPPNVLLLTMVTGLTVRHFLRPAHRSTVPRLFWPCSGFFACLVAATMISSLVTGRTEATARLLVTRIGYFLTFMLIVWLVRDMDKLKRILRLLLLSAGLAAIVTIAGGFWPDHVHSELVRCEMAVPFLFFLNTPRCVGLFGNFPAFGTWVVMAIPVAFWCVKHPQSLGIKRWFSVALIPVLLLSLAVAQIRGAWVALLAIVPLALLPVARRFREKAANDFLHRALFGVLAFAIALALASIIVWVTNATYAIRTVTVDERIYLIKLVFQLLKSNIFFGLGPLDERFLLFGELNLPGLHNTTLVELGSTGIIGFIPYVALVFIAFRSAIQVMRKTSVPDLRGLAFVSLVQLCAVMVSLQSYIGIGEKAPWITMALAVSLRGINDKRERNKRNSEIGDNVN